MTDIKRNSTLESQQIANGEVKLTTSRTYNKGGIIFCLCLLEKPLWKISGIHTWLKKKSVLPSEKIYGLLGQQGFGI